MSITYTWYGHATHGLNVDGVKIVVDPYFNDNPAAIITAEQVEADYILVSHGHFDHVTDLIDVARRTGATAITNFEIANWLGEKGIPAHAQHIGGGYHHPFGYLKLTQALHGSGLPDFGYGGNPCGFLLTTLDGKKIYLACDTGLFGDMSLIGDEGIDLAVLPIGDNFTMGPDDALRAVKFVRPRHVIPVHYNTWPLIAQDADAWAARVRAETGSQAHVLTPGESFTLD
jgi:L-ascorbate metabolism protein UlaG (beta-lactamase superfamily)